MYVVSGSSDSTVCVVEVATGKLVHTFKNHSNVVRSVAWSKSGGLLASVSYDGQTIV